LLDIQVPDIQGVILNELAPGLDLFPHQFGEHLLGLHHIGYFHPQELAVEGVHRRFKELLGVHFAQTFEALDLDAMPADLLDCFKDFGDGEKLACFGPYAFAFGELKERFILGRVMLDGEASAGELFEQIRDGGALIEFNMGGATGPQTFGFTVFGIVTVTVAILIFTVAVFILLILIEAEIGIVFRELKELLFGLAGIMPRVKDRGSGGVVELPFRDGSELRRLIERLRF